LIIDYTSPSKQNKSAAEVASSEAKDYHPICQAAAHMEISFNMSKLYHEFAKFCDCVPRLCNEQGTCKVQVLRSVGKWSIGTKAEPSILNCYIETIQNSLRFIYIENQFFIGNLAGDGTQNKIAEALLERILRAHSQRQPFRVVVIIPLHPNGDFANAMKSQVVMHYEYMTINRSPNSLLQQLKKRAPGINVQDYINFYSLRNWGVINDKVVSDQIYVHDKLMIVDDRVMIIGSANINDRSMMGFRDSEVAVRIEDTLHVESTLCGQPHTVGFLPHSVRVKLMRQHLGNPPDLGKTRSPPPLYYTITLILFLWIDLTDPLNPQTYEVWRSCAANNSASYDELDGPLSYYRCTGSLMYKNALDNFPNRSYLDPDTRHCLDQIKGFLVDWPYNFFSGEDLSPSLATRAIIPNEMWL
jgi:phospholipase D1/2